MEGLLAAVLLIGGGLTALQTASILTAIPFSLILIVMCYSFYKSLTEYEEDVTLINLDKLNEIENLKVEEKEVECVIEEM